MNQKEIWLVNLTPTVGAEITKTRPCVILNSDEIGILPLKVIAPITDYKAHYDSVPWMVPITPDGGNNLAKNSVVDTFQLRSVSQDRMIRKLGEISENRFREVVEALKLVFGLY